MKNFNILGVHRKIFLKKFFLLKNFFLGGGMPQKTIHRGTCLNSPWGEVWTVCRFKGRGLGKNEEGVFEEGG